MRSTEESDFLNGEACSPRADISTISRIPVFSHSVIFKPPATPFVVSRKRGGFSLVEVTLALGIAAFGLVTLMGIMPIGLAASQEASRQTVTSHILQRISSDLDLLPFSDLATYTSSPQLYDWDGQLVQSQAEAVFIVSLEAQAPSYPESTTLADIQSRIGRVVVKIRRVGQAESTAVRKALTIANSGL